MGNVTHILSAIEQGDPNASRELLAIVYDELRQMAGAQMAHERVAHTLQPTALVHEAYLRLVGDANPHWEGRGHFFGAVAEAMRRILVDHARTRNAAKRGGGRGPADLDVDQLTVASGVDEILDVLLIDDALAKLAAEAPAKAELVKLRYFAGLSVEDSAKALGISEATAKRYWVSARAWLFNELEQSR